MAKPSEWPIILPPLHRPPQLLSGRQFTDKPDKDLEDPLK